MENIIAQWNAHVAKCVPVTKYSAPHVIRTASINTNGIKSSGINLCFEEDVSIKYYGFLVVDKDDDLAIEYAYYTAETGIKYLDKKRVKVAVRPSGLDTLDVDTGPLYRALSNLKKFKPSVPVEEAMDVLQRQIRSILNVIEVEDQRLV